MTNTMSKSLSGSNPKNQLSGWASTLINIFFVIYSALCILPLLLILSVSFSDEQSVMTHGYRFMPENFNLAAYRFLMKDISQIVHSYGISLTVTVIGTILSVIIIALYAYPISRNNFPQAKYFTFFVFLTMLISGGLVPWYLVYVQMLELKDTLWALIMPLIMSAFWVLIMRTFFKETVPEAVLESAKNRWGRGATDIYPNCIAIISAGSGNRCTVPNTDILERLVPKPNVYYRQPQYIRAVLSLQDDGQHPVLIQ